MKKSYFHGQSPASRRLAAVVVVTTAVACAAGCLTRPVISDSPTTNSNFTSTLRTTAVTKVDLVFMIDNSASMGDKQEYLIQAIPDLISRLVTPNCVDTNGQPIKQNGTILTTSDGTCAQGTHEFNPVHDLHIALVSSSLGTRTGLTGPQGAVCDPTPNGQAHQDDRGQLVNRSRKNAAQPIADLLPSNFLSWFPPTAKGNIGVDAGAGATPLSDPNVLKSDFADLVGGVSEDGCGIESQLESWYRFLIQPDPYDHIDTTKGTAAWVGIDSTIIQERHDFLRPDSLVAIIDLTDENDSEIDVRSFNGTGYNFLSTQFNPPRGTTPCATNPADPGCQVCEHGSTDPNCLADAGPYTDPFDWGYDPNLRHVHMKQKYGGQPQFPLTRYVNGLSSSMVPNRDDEYPAGVGTYDAHNPHCVNPLFAASLPDGSVTDPAALCNLTLGQLRTSDLIFFAHIGGVPWQLLHFDPTNAKASLLGQEDWVKILGNKPEVYDYSGIDPHMIESQTPRPQIAAQPSSPSTTDPIHGREWDTINPKEAGKHSLRVDREYACTFALSTPRDCTDPKNALACDCPNDAGALTHEQTPSVCDDNNPTSQIRAKAYPTIRELQLANLMAKQGIVSSICPIHVTEQGAGDPLFGYRPAVAAIIDRVKNALTAVCTPEKLTPRSTGEVPCLLLETLPSPTMDCTGPGLGPTDPEILAKFREHQKASFTASDAGGQIDPSTLPVCTVNQLVVPQGQTCATDQQNAGWCYTVGVGSCPHSVAFSAAGNPISGAVVSLQCISGP